MVVASEPAHNSGGLSGGIYTLYIKTLPLILLLLKVVSDRVGRNRKSFLLSAIV
jgi:hypothetical protein